MTTIIGPYGETRTFGSQSLVLNQYKPNDRITRVKAVRSTNVNPANGVTISWESVVWDTHGFITSFPSTNIVIPVNGWYSGIAHICAASYTAHNGRIGISINGVEVAADRVSLPTGSGSMMNSLNVMFSMRYCAKGDIITVTWDTSGGTINMVTNGEAGCSCAVWRSC